LFYYIILNAHKKETESEIQKKKNFIRHLLYS